MKPLKPYLINAVCRWVLDRNHTPYVVVDTTAVDVQAPFEYASDDQLLLNIHPQAVTRYQVDESGLQFSARFSGVSRSIFLPLNSVVAVYAHETGEGLTFPEPEDRPGPEDHGPKPEDSDDEKSDSRKTGKPYLRRVK